LHSKNKNAIGSYNYLYLWLKIICYICNKICITIKNVIDWVVTIIVIDKSKHYDKIIII